VLAIHGLAQPYPQEQRNDLSLRSAIPSEQDRVAEQIAMLPALCAIASFIVHIEAVVLKVSVWSPRVRAAADEAARRELFIIFGVVT
jgi:hypothetical protein